MFTSVAASNDDNVCDVSQSLLQRLRISGSKKSGHLTKHPLVLPPFRRRTESVNTIMSFNSMSDSTPDNTSPATNTEEVSATHLISEHKEVLSPLAWLEQECPGDIVPKILAFCGPQLVAALSKTNKHWNTVVHQEKTWRIMCEELYKVREKEDFRVTFL